MINSENATCRDAPRQNAILIHTHQPFDHSAWLGFGARVWRIGSRPLAMLPLAMREI
jgi:hypothetical protein